MPETVTEKAALITGLDTSMRIQPGSSRLTSPSRAVNRTFIRQINETRPPFIGIELYFDDSEDEHYFKYAAISGAFFYRASPPNFSSHLIVAVGDRILAGFITPYKILFTRIYKGIDPSWHNSYFCQALNILIWQNGKQSALFWTGDPSKQMKFTYESEYVKDGAMPVGNFMVYAHNRLFVATPEDLVYASDYIYSQEQSIRGREAVLSFRESTYPSSGDGFGSPAEMGRTTGMMVMPRSGEVNGHGDVFVLCENGAYTISPASVPRNEWTDADIQRIAFIGAGCVSSDSIITFNNQPYYRDIDGGITNLLASVQSYSNKTAYIEIGRPAMRYLDIDKNSPDLKFCQAVSTADRMFFGSHIVKDFSTVAGIHRYSNALISCCAITASDGRSYNSWEGIWTGPRVAAAVECISGNKRALFISHDSDGENRIYELGNSKGDDRLLSGSRRIRGSFVHSNIFYPDTAGSPLTRKRIEAVSGLLIESNGTLSISYSPEFTEENFNIDLDMQFNGPGKGSMYFQSMNPCSGIRDDNSKVSSTATCFNFRIITEGEVNFAGLVFDSVLELGKVGNKCLVSSNKAIELPPSGPAEYSEYKDYNF